MSKGKLVVITGPSGVGKSTIVREAIRRTGAKLSVSATTRPPRTGEADGRDYHFVDRPAFDGMVDRGELLEWAEVFGERYGTPCEPVERALAAGRTIILEIDVQGALQVHEKMPDSTFILIVPPSEAELSRRLRSRGSEDEQAVSRRLAEAQVEVDAARKSGLFEHEVANDVLAEAIERVVEIVGGGGLARGQERPPGGAGDSG
jgi:guanylate kinase